MATMETGVLFTYKARLLYKVSFRNKIIKSCNVVAVVVSLYYYCFGRYTFSGKTYTTFRELGSLTSTGT